ncbi:MAG: acyl-CoA dehydrogenase family protein [Paenibacillus macerans]|uniref:acyl-CoA dehydrogenase family protein n=1 Tax=Paenibacillus TaxID=44249 RepID=UPI002910665C|nr:acyl-CoA dehydrogenase family protein [Paenibacillus macerans]MDU7477339.1 acyl-CoA dehydrogenase family protein [Paenibacillus macerans]
MNSIKRSWFKEQLAQIIEEDIRPEAAAVDEHARFPVQALAALKRGGLLGLLVPEPYGGLGGSITEFTYAVEQIARACSSTAAVFFFHGQFVRRLEDFGNAEHQAKYFPRLADGYLGASSWSELQAGAGKNNLSTTARLQGSRLLINGSKAFCTSAGEADVYSVLVKFEGEDGPQTSFVLVEKEDLNVSFGQSWNGMGIRGSSTREIICAELSLPHDRILSAVGDGHRIMEQNKKNAIHPGIIGLGVARAALGAFLTEIQERPQLWGYQNTRMTVSDIATSVDALEALTYLAARSADDRKAQSAFQAMQAKTLAAQVCVEAADKLLHLAGARAYTKGHALERLCRDAKAIGLMGPTTEIAKEYIAQILLEEMQNDNRLRPCFI